MADEEEFQGGEVESSAPEPVVTDADGEVVATGAEAAEASAPESAYEWQGVADYARQYGVDLPGSDAQALQTLLSAYRSSQQRNFYADYGMRMAPYADQIQAWIAQQQQQVAAPPSRPAWQPPEWDPRWLQMVERDPNTGHLYAKPGVDPRIADKVLAYADWQDKFRENPAEFIQPMVEARARDIVNQEFASYRQNSTADQLVAQNANWMFAYQPNGAPILMQDGSRALSPAGALYARSVNQIWNSGVHDVQQCHALARSVVENAILRQQWMQQQASGGGQASRAEGAKYFFHLEAQDHAPPSGEQHRADILARHGDDSTGLSPAGNWPVSLSNAILKNSGQSSAVSNGSA